MALKGIFLLFHLKKKVLFDMLEDVCRNLRKKLERSSHPLKEELVLGIMELLEGDDEEEDDSEMETSKTWLNSVDRGGLWHINNATLMMFLAMEDVVRQQLRKAKIRSLSHGRKSALIQQITSDEAVGFHWCIATADLGKEERQVLLDMVIELWITIRGFSFVSGWIEQYKLLNKKTLKKSKALRSNLSSSSDNH